MQKEKNIQYSFFNCGVIQHPRDKSFFKRLLGIGTKREDGSVTAGSPISYPGSNDDPEEIDLPSNAQEMSKQKPPKPKNP
jgi:hypothetical protein